MIDYTVLGPAELMAHIRAHIDEVRTRYAPLAQDQLRWRPSPENWSVGQCLQHLVVMDSLYLATLEAAIADARRRGLTDDGPYKGGLFGRWFTSQVGPQLTRKMKAPAKIAPGEAPGVPGDIAATFIAIQTRLLAAIEGASGIDLHRTRITSPVSAIVRLRAIDAMRSVVAHDRRHLNQAQRVVEAPDFPPQSRR
jgi:hypothetical protein